MYSVCVSLFVCVCVYLCACACKFAYKCACVCVCRDVYELTWRGSGLGQTRRRGGLRQKQAGRADAEVMVIAARPRLVALICRLDESHYVVY